ncbi:hypothetical protein EWM64_g5764 [Hericium alpestre]|uniref:non-specific serine/threonine protein kinase n=1 Tax=Hericium alpestre TaxID=135208 RepID=A0A4Y9ZUH2_9AGAM|nr:hypothetical protein EWM64_g5764 [Hericium alpestre]
MSSAPSSSPAFPIQTFQASATPAALLDFLRELVDDKLQKPLEDKAAWITVISGLCDNMLSSFPSLAGGSWDVLHEKVTLVDVTLEVIRRVIAKLDGYVFDADQVVLRLLNLCGALDTRRDPEILDDAVPSPKQLREKAFMVAVETLKYLGNTICQSNTAEKTTWEIMKRIVQECLESGRVTLTLFRAPRIQTFESKEAYEADPASMDVDAPPEDVSWKDRVRASVQSILAIVRVCEVQEIDAPLVNWALNSILTGLQMGSLERTQDVMSSEQRISISKALYELPCLLAHHAQSQCTRLTEADDNLLTIYSTLVHDLLQGDSTVVTHSVRKSGFDVLGRAVHHLSVECVHANLDGVCSTLIRGLMDPNRGVRLSAGRALGEVVCFYQKIGKTAYSKIEQIFDAFYGLLDTGKDPVKETVMISVTAVGKMFDSNILSVTISCLMSQLGHSNPVLKGVAYTQLLSLAKYYRKSNYGLVIPYIDKIAPYLIQRWHSHPALLMEACRFFKMSTSDFISYHLPRTLPDLFAACELKVLEKISKDLETEPSLLFLRHSEDVLAHVYLLTAPGKTNHVLKFIVKLVTDATEGQTVDITNILRSCIVPLLAKLVNVLGEDDQTRVEAATQALHKVEASLRASLSKRKELLQSDLAQFLKDHMLGVVSHLIDMLQDIQGKKTTESKRQILRSLGALTSKLGPAISSVAPQMMATLQMMLVVPELSDATLETWHTFLTTLTVQEAGPQVGPTTASIVSSWSAFSEHGQGFARKILEYLIFDLGNKLGNHADDIADFEDIGDLVDLHDALWALRKGWKEPDRLRRLLDRANNDNVTVALQAFRELRTMMAQNREFFQDLATGDVFHTSVGRILEVIFSAICRDTDAVDDLRLLAYECLGALGAVDPDRSDFGLSDSRMIVLRNFTDEGESVNFALHLITEVLVGTFRSTSDITYQTNLAYAIQELLRFCQFTPALVSSGSASGIPLRVRNRWSHLPKHVLETVTPLLEARFSAKDRPAPVLDLPIYPKQPTYREWIQLWTTHLISRISGDTARTIFSVFRSAVRNKDVGVAHHLLPHLVLTTLVSGQEQDTTNVRAELLAVLQDQVDANSVATPDKKLLSAQAVFMLLDHLNKWVRLVRLELGNKKADAKRSRASPADTEMGEQLMRVDSILSSIDQDLMAKAAFKCKAYARSLMSFERHIGTLRDRNASNVEVQQCYERLHEIYANLDEPDGMEGVSTLILSPTLEHQIRQHESTGRWTSAQSCWELRLQQSPDNLDYHVGLLKCLRNLGHYDTLRTHVKGVLTRNPAWKSALADFQVESAWMIGDWNEVGDLVQDTDMQTSSMVVARLLLAVRADDTSVIQQALSRARLVLGNPIMTAGAREYRHSYDAVLSLHLVHEIQMIRESMVGLPLSGSNSAKLRRETLGKLSRDLSARLELTLPTFRIREPVLSMRRTTFGLWYAHFSKSSSRGIDMRLLTSAKKHRHLGHLEDEIGRSWLASAKIARKAGHWQTAYSAMLQAEQAHTPFSFIQSARLIRANGEPLRALHALQNSIRVAGLGADTPADVIDLTEDDDETKQMKAKAEVLHARWMNDSDRFEHSDVLKSFQHAAELWPKYLLYFFLSTLSKIRILDECMAMANELLALCDYPVKDDNKKTLSMKKDVPGLARLAPSKLIIPLQESLIATLPPTSSASDSQHQPFPLDTPTFHRFLDEIDIMRSLAKPRKITIVGNSGETYMFLGKPKDDLRKDARLMDFNAIINKLLKANSDSRRRQLHIRTYGVVTLNEECGFIQWVPDTIPIRPVLIKYYDARGIKSWYQDMHGIFNRIKEAPDREAGQIFVREILVKYPPVFHEWFIETFPEPTAWLASRLTYGRTAAVMSMVGFILGLGDRHCENILLDANSGAAVHVDFNCLFEKGKTLEVPERVPFRLTQNIVDGLGVTGVEGVFRIACEHTMQLLRDNRDTLMSVLDAFVHDPLVEWEDEKRKLDREAARRPNANAVKQSVDLRVLAKGALQPIEKKLKGIYSTSRERPEKEISTSNLVQMLIQEASDDVNLGKMYPGWAPWH